MKLFITMLTLFGVFSAGLSAEEVKSAKSTMQCVTKFDADKDAGSAFFPSDFSAYYEDNSNSSSGCPDEVIFYLVSAKSRTSHDSAPLYVDDNEYEAYLESIEEGEAIEVISPHSRSSHDSAPFYETVQKVECIYRFELSDDYAGHLTCRPLQK